MGTDQEKAKRQTSVPRGLLPKDRKIEFIKSLKTGVHFHCIRLGGAYRWMSMAYTNEKCGTDDCVDIKL